MRCTAMLCPVCKKEMVDVEHDRIELDYCVKCRGVWFDANELELLLDKYNLQDCDLTFSKLKNKTSEDIAEKKQKCPVCKKTMGKIKIGDSSQTIIDICVNGDGLWFDGGEVVQLIRHASKDIQQESNAEQQVINFLGEVFRI
jgi:hypothetical protein